MNAEEWDRRYAATDLVWSASPNEFVVSELEGLAPGRAYDMACGEGRNALWLASRGWTVTGADFSSVALAKAAQLARASQTLHGTVRWVHADATTDVPEPGSVDLMLVAYLQIAAEPRRAALRLATSALAPGGHLLVIAHDSSNLVDGAGGPQDPKVLYTAQDVLRDLEPHDDLRAVRAERVPRAVRADGEMRTAWDALVHLQRR